MFKTNIFLDYNAILSATNCCNMSDLIFSICNEKKKEKNGREGYDGFLPHPGRTDRHARPIGFLSASSSRIDPPTPFSGEDPRAYITREDPSLPDLPSNIHHKQRYVDVQMGGFRGPRSPVLFHSDASITKSYRMTRPPHLLATHTR